MTVPNLASPVFQSFLGWAEATGRLYEDEHFDISVPDLAEELGCKVAVADGCRLFLPRAEHYAASDSELDDFNDELRKRLIAAGGARYADFPHMDFTAADIDVLHAVEEAASTEERMHFGFLHYYLLDARPEGPTRRAPHRYSWPALNSCALSSTGPECPFVRHRAATARSPAFRRCWRLQ